ncbi:hypothetical protein BDD12DRAFT_894352 [Trichophaea hybrida]|nr:hypothetical protein BDD12DRAFT_894352 [Trichophaea hybrida]
MSLKRTVKPDGKAVADNTKRRHLETALELSQKVAPLRLAASSAPADVEIAIFDHVYHLHAISLRNCSKVFDKGLSDRWWKPENTHNGEDGIKYRYKLVVDVKDPMSSIVEPVPPQRDGDRTSGSSFRNPNDNSQLMAITTKALQQAYARIFHIFYHKAYSENATFSSIKHLVTLANLYCCLPVVAQTAESMLIAWSRCRGTVVEIRPIDTILLAIKIRSKIIYHDAFIHLVGGLENGDIGNLQMQKLPAAVRERIWIARLDIAQMCTGVYQAMTWFTMAIAKKRIDVPVPLKTFFDDTKGEDYDAAQYRKLLDIVNMIKTDSKMCQIDSLQKSISKVLHNRLRLNYDTASYNHLVCATGGDIYPWDNESDW